MRDNEQSNRFYVVFGLKGDIDRLYSGSAQPGSIVRVHRHFGGHFFGLASNDTQHRHNDNAVTFIDIRITTLHSQWVPMPAPLIARVCPSHPRNLPSSPKQPYALSTTNREKHGSKRRAKQARRLHTLYRHPRHRLPLDHPYPPARAATRRRWTRVHTRLASFDQD